MKLPASPVSALAKTSASTASAKTAARQRRLYAHWALIFIALGALALARNLQLLPPGPAADIAAYWPLLAVVAGLYVVLTGRHELGMALPPFAVDRGAFQAAHLHVDTGASDVRLGPFAGMSQLAVGEFPAYDGPRLRLEGHRARLEMDRRAAAPLLFGDWSASLLKGLPWSLSLRSFLGHFLLDLRDLTVTAIDVQSAAGDVDLALPAQGQGEARLRLAFGDLALRVPETMAVRISAHAGALSRVDVDERRFPRISATEWRSPDYADAPAQFTLEIALTTGDLVVR